MFASLKKRLGAKRDRTGAAPSDSRSGRLVFLIEGLLNQNARDAGAATCSSVSGSLKRLRKALSEVVPIFFC